jgi:hypothetical protein
MKNLGFYLQSGLLFSIYVNCENDGDFRGKKLYGAEYFWCAKKLKVLLAVE